MLEFLGSKPIIIKPVETQLSGDAGLLPIRKYNELNGLTQQFADVRCSDQVFKMLAGRSPDSRDLASQPTLCRGLKMRSQCGHCSRCGTS